MQSIQITQKAKISGILRLKDIFYSGVNLFLRIPNAVFYVLLFISSVIIEYSNFHLSPDLSIQLHTLKNFVGGHGIALATLDDNGLVIYQPYSLWPAGLVLFLTPIYLITKSAITSLLILKLIGYIFFLLFLSNYLNYLKLKDHQKKFIILFFIVSIAPFVYFNASDTIATTLCMWSFYFYIKYQDDEKITHLLLSIFLVSFCYFIKYSFLPFLFYPAVAFVLKEKLDVFKKFKQFALIILFTLSSGLLFYYLNKLLVGPVQIVTSMDAFNGNPHWNQLTRFDGFLFNFGIYEWFFENLIKSHLGISFQFNWLSILVTFYFYWLFVKMFFKRGRYPDNTRFLNSINISISSGAMLIGFLCFLTINNPGQTWTKPYWTFVEETRYYGPVIIVGLINVLIIFLIKKKGSLIHIIVPIMIFLNLFAYRTVMQSGFWGNNYKSYLLMKSNIFRQMQINDSLKRPVVYFDKVTQNSNFYYYLQANGIILLEKNKIGSTKNNEFSNFILEKDSNDSFRILKVN